LYKNSQFAIMLIAGKLLDKYKPASGENGLESSGRQSPSSRQNWETAPAKQRLIQGIASKSK
jgi:hypothetical protein